MVQDYCINFSFYYLLQKSFAHVCNYTKLLFVFREIVTFTFLFLFYFTLISK